MFTGIIRHIGVVSGIRPQPGGQRLAIDLGSLAERLQAGDSVAVSGACLTAATVGAGGGAEFDVVAETLSRTTLGRLRVGSRVNLERALRASDPLEGHLVQGHVDGVATVAAVRGAGGEHRIEFEAPELTGAMVPKGSVAVDGVSLTLAHVAGARFSVAVIPATLAATTLGDLAPGEAVNVETDVIGKYVRKYLEHLAGTGGVTLEKLRGTGFM